MIKAKLVIFLTDLLYLSITFMTSTLTRLLVSCCRPDRWWLCMARTWSSHSRARSLSSSSCNDCRIRHCIGLRGLGGPWRYGGGVLPCHLSSGKLHTPCICRSRRFPDKYRCLHLRRGRLSCMRRIEGRLAAPRIRCHSTCKFSSVWVGPWRAAGHARGSTFDICRLLLRVQGRLAFAWVLFHVSSTMHCVLKGLWYNYVSSNLHALSIEDIWYILIQFQGILPSSV